MEEQVSLFEDGIGRLQTGFRNVGGELQKLQLRATKNGRDISERAQAQALEIQKQLLEFPPIKAADNYRGEVYKQLESSLLELWHRLPVASQDDVTKLEKKVNSMSRKIRALEKTLAEYE